MGGIQRRQRINRHNLWIIFFCFVWFTRIFSRSIFMNPTSFARSNFYSILREKGRGNRKFAQEWVESMWRTNNNMVHRCVVLAQTTHCSRLYLYADTHSVTVSRWIGARARNFIIFFFFSILFGLHVVVHLSRSDVVCPFSQPHYYACAFIESIWMAACRAH